MNNYVLLSVSTRFIRDWITSRYLDQILQIIKRYKKDLTRIEFKIIEKETEHAVKDNISSNEKMKMFHLLKIHIYSIIELILINDLIIL